MTEIVMPGDRVRTQPSGSADTQIIGYGIEKKQGEFLALQPGTLRSQGKKHWISVQARRYTPQTGDLVLGVVTGKIGDLFKVDIGCADQANISYLAFEGATKRNRPNVRVGDLLYARVLTTSKHIEPELTCVDGELRSRGLGVLPSEGISFRVPLHVARRTLSSKSQLLHILGKDFKFEITIGLNGRIWLKCDEHRELVFLRRVIARSEYVHDSLVPEFVEKEVRRLRGFDSSALPQP